MLEENKKIVIINIGQQNPKHSLKKLYVFTELFFLVQVFSAYFGAISGFPPS